MIDNDLDDFFAEARGAVAEPSSGLLARIQQDASVQQEGFSAVRPRQSPEKQGVWATMLAAIGGGAALAGLSTATLAGLYLGFAQPSSLTSVTGTIWNIETVDSVELIPSFDDILTEG